MAQREEWGTRAGFILAAVGSAVGLGNIWRFPMVAFDNGGGAFFVPYLFALVTAGIPLLVLEYTIGHRFRASAPLSFRRMNRKAEFVGWWQIAVGFVISTYYAVVIAWAAAYAWFSFRLSWGEDTEGFFFASFLNAADREPGQIGAPVAGVLVPLLAIWAVTIFISYKGIRRGIELANRVMIPTLVVVFLMLVVRAVSLEGSTEGLGAFFTPDWEAMTDTSVWVAAYAQIFFSLSIAFAIMITYSSYLKRDSDLTNNAFIAAFSNSSFELLAGIGVFAALGFMATAAGVGVTEVAEGGVALAFVVFPMIINELPALNSFFGVLFFGSLVLAGVSSLISIVQTYVAATQDKFAWSRHKAVLASGGAATLVSVAFATEGGVFFLDAADHFINNFGVAVVGFAEVVLVAWLLRRLPEFQAHANRVSDIALGLWWRAALLVVTPVMLGLMILDNFRGELASNYEDYPTSFLLSSGWAVVGAAVVAGLILSRIAWRRPEAELLLEEGMS